MAEAPAQERTEDATPHRLQKAREEGQIPQSKELPSALLLALLLVVLALAAEPLCGWFCEETRTALSLETRRPLTLDAYNHLFRTKVVAVAMAIAPFLLAGCVVAVGSGLLVGGWSLAPKAMQPKSERVSPISGIKRMFSLQSVVNLGISLAKLGVLAIIVWTYLSGKKEECLSLRWQSSAAMLAEIARMIFGLVLRLSIAILAIALADWLYQRWNYFQKLKMTKEEVRQENKDQEMSSQVKGRIRGIQIESAKRRMLQEVPDADVVVVNPTHVAVALKYTAGKMAAPMVVAKGPDLLCEQIKTIAREHQVPIVQKPELARAIYQASDVGQAIPQTLFVAVAEILAMVYRMRQRRLGAAAGPDNT